MLCWLNGEIVEAEEARISPFDRGFLFGDGVYEVVQYFNRVGVGVDLHIERMRKSLSRARISGFDPEAALPQIGESLLERSDLHDALLYVQVTRGAQIPRTHLPRPGLRPTVFGYAIAGPSIAELEQPRTIKTIVLPDDRWRHCAIKSISLIANILAAMEGEGRGAQEVILHRDGFITEGSMTNVFVIEGGRIATPPIDTEPSILAGVTRALVIEAAASMRQAVEERPVRVQELASADEVFVASTRRLIDAVGSIDGRTIGNGGPGTLTAALFERLRATIAERCGCSLQSLT